MPDNINPHGSNKAAETAKQLKRPDLEALRTLAYHRVFEYLLEVDPAKLSPTVVTGVLKGDMENLTSDQVIKLDQQLLDEIDNKAYGIAA